MNPRKAPKPSFQQQPFVVLPKTVAAMLAPKDSWWTTATDFYATARQQYSERMCLGTGAVYTPSQTEVA